MLATVTLGLLTVSSAWAREDTRPARMAPPTHLACERNQLTSYNGTLAAYERGERATRIVIDTDWGTRETVVIDHGSGTGPEAAFLLNGKPFDHAAWAQISAAGEPTKPATGTRLIAWVCLDDETPPMIDWQP